MCNILLRRPGVCQNSGQGLTFISQQQVNIGKLEATGIDFDIRYLFDLSSATVRSPPLRVQWPESKSKLAVLTVDGEYT